MSAGCCAKLLRRPIIPVVLLSLAFVLLASGAWGSQANDWLVLEAVTSLVSVSVLVH